jgi:hypothetical protein
MTPIKMIRTYSYLEALLVFLLLQDKYNIFVKKQINFTFLPVSNARYN